MFCNWCGARQIREAKKEIKVPEPVQLPSGSWRIQLRKEGISVVEPTAEKCRSKAIAIRSGYYKDQAKKTGITLTAAIDRYIESKSEILSPETIRGYRIIQKHRFPDLMNKDIAAISMEMCQRAVNKEAKKLSPKSVKNAWYFILTVMNTVERKDYDLSLPMQVTKEIEFLSGEQIPLFMDAIRDTDIELFCLLALSSLRRSEIYGLRWEDLDLEDKRINIHGAMVYDADGNRIRKDTNKNVSSQRSVPIFIPRLIEILQEADRSEPLIKVSYSAVCRRINAITETAGLPRITPHGLRHSFASMALITLQLPEKVVMEIGGWSDTSTMKKIYTHASKAELNKRAAQLEEFFKTS